MSCFNNLGRAFGRLSSSKTLDPFAPKEKINRGRMRASLGRRTETGKAFYPPFCDDDFFLAGYETGWTRICYVDRDGVMSVRDINRKYVDDDEIEAYCALRHDLRTFKRERIKWMQETEVPSDLPADWRARKEQRL
jgi:hypothetical protein